ncbi:MAG: hypothetical protein R3F59_14035 [Myxococcota bacterium]
MWLLSLFAGCDGGEPVAADVPTYHADVAPILAGRCVGCHQAGGIGTFPLETYEEARDVAPVLASVVDDRLMPPWKAVPGHIAYANDPSLTEAQVRAIVDWADQGAPEGDPADAGEPLAPVAGPLPRTDVSLEMPVDYSPDLSLEDEYRCFPLAWSDDGPTSYVTGFDVVPGNSSVVHHVAAFLVRPDGLGGEGVLQMFRDWDGTDGKPGYSCFGGPSLSGSEVQVPIQQLAQWVPGSGATVFPDGVGIPVPPGSLVVLQLHYNTVGSDGNPDRTRIALMTEPDVPRIGAFAPYLDPLWTFGGGMNIPSGREVTHSVGGSPYGFFSLLLGDLDLSAGFDIHAVMLHMHNTGERGLVRVDRGDGTAQTLLEVADWDFDWQLNYGLADALPFGPDDELFLECTFDNETGEDLHWGEGSDQEMCVANLFVSVPR